MNRENDPGLLFLQVPGIPALPLTHLLRSAFCFREDVPSLGDRATWMSEGLPEDRLDAQSVLAGHFGREAGLGSRFRSVLRDPRAWRVTALADPCTVRCAVYRHLVTTNPELADRKPAVFGSLEGFLAQGGDFLTRHLAESLGQRRVNAADFDAVWIEEEGEASFRRVVERLKERAERQSEPAIRGRQVAFFEALLIGSESLITHFGDSAAPEAGVADAGFRRRNAADYRFLEACRKGARPRRRWPARRAAIVRSPQDEPVFIFNHLPKCYGTSVRALFQGAFGMMEDHTRVLDREGVLDGAPLAVEWLAADTILCGHFCHDTMLLSRRLPGVWERPERYKLFTFVRDPLATAISNYRHVVERYPGQAAANPKLFATLEGYLLEMPNPIATRLEADTRSIDAIFERYFFVGTTENHEAGVPELLTRMSAILAAAPETSGVRRARVAVTALQDARLPHANAAGVKAMPEVSREVQEQFRRNNALDYEIYERARADMGGFSIGGKGLG